MKRQEDVSKPVNFKEMNMQQVMRLVSSMTENQVVKVTYPLYEKEKGRAGVADG